MRDSTCSLSFTRTKNIWRKPLDYGVFGGMKKVSCSHSLLLPSASIHSSSIHHFFFFSFVWFCLQTRAVTEEVGVVLVNCIELIFVRTGIFCDVRGVNVKA